MTPKTFIIIGRSGAGKGTQADLLSKYLKQIDPSHETLYVQSGGEFRDFVSGPTFTQQKAREVYDTGGLEPEFLAVYMWAKVFVDKYTADKHLIIDGTPRKAHEVGVLYSVFDFYGIKNPYVLYINVSPEWSRDHLKGRHRRDDTSEDIEARLNWFDTDVLPNIEGYRHDPFYTMIDINGEQTIEAVHQEIIKKIALK